MDSHDAVLVAQKLDSILDRLDKVETQNEKIAKGIVAVADMIDELNPKPKMHMAPRQYIQQNLPQQQPSQPPPSDQPQQLPSYNLPPEEKKKNFLNFKI